MDGSPWGHDGVKMRHDVDPMGRDESQGGRGFSTARACLICSGPKAGEPGSSKGNRARPHIKVWVVMSADGLTPACVVDA